jgi:drug/metabolite transporter (DMT)-like permease
MPALTVIEEGQAAGSHPARKGEAASVQPVAGRSSRRSGYVLVLAATVCFGTLGTFSKLFYDAGGDAYTLLFLRFVITGPALALLAVALGNPLPGRRLALLGASLGVFQFGVGYALFEGFARAPVALVTLLYFAYPLVTAVGAALLFREELGPRRIAVLGVALAGVALTVGVPDSATWLGIVLGLVAGLCVACLILSGRYLLTRHPLSPLVLGGLMFTSPAIGLALAVPARAPHLSLGAEAWGWALAAVFVAAVVPIALFYTGVQRTEAGVVGLLSSAEPLVSVLLAYAVLDESLTALRLVGGGLIVASVVALSLQAPRPVREPGETTVREPVS